MSALALLAAVSLANPLAPTGGAWTAPDAGPAYLARDPSPQAAALATDAGVVIVWADDRRSRAFGKANEATDLWLNVLQRDLTFAHPFGVVAKRAALDTTLSQPRLAASPGTLHLAWRSTRTGDANAFVAAGTVSADGRVRDGTTLATATTPRTSLELTSNGATVVATWETPTNVEAKYLDRPLDGPYTFARSAAGSLFARPTVGVVPGLTPFTMLLQSARLQRLTLGAGGLSQGGFVYPEDPSARFATFLGVGDALVLLRDQPDAGLRPRVVLAGLDGGAGVELSGVVGPDDGPLAAGVSDKQVWVLPLLRSGAGLSFELSEEGALASLASSVSVGLATHAVTPWPAGGVLAVGPDAFPGRKLQVAWLPPGLPTAQQPLPPLDPQADEVAPSAAWVADAGWRLARTQRADPSDGLGPASLLSSSLSGPDNLLSPATQGSGSRLRLVASRLHTAVAVFDDGRPSTRLVAAAPAPRGVTVSATAEVLLTLNAPAATERGAAVGERLFVLWERPSATYTYGGNRLGPRREQLMGASLARCGAWTERGEFLLPTDDLGDLLVLRFVDALAPDGGPAAEADTLTWPDPGAGRERCLALSGDRALLVSEADGNVVAHLGTLGADDVASLGPTLFPPMRRGARPVAVPLADGWLVAWDLSTANDWRVMAAFMGADGQFGDVVQLSDGSRDSRHVALAAGPQGDAVAAWEEFVEGIGAARPVFVHFGVAGDGGLVFADGGVFPRSAGSAVTPSDGGANLPDGGSTGADGGEDGSDLAAFESCGCAADASLALVLAATLALRSRPRRRASPRRAAGA